ncbi:MAG: SusD/RagB family nutrient-binding outer membrane lipoprotein [Saprospiraceae bacterium]|nr:SusD/RagB family nutrient-binding outer membrane lipoprotein [Saprospiraceae bacterium]
MKNIKRYSFLLLLFGASSCGNEFGDLNVDPNNPSGVLVEFLLTQAERSIATNISGTIASDISGTDGLMLAQYWALHNYTGVTRYYIAGDWSTMYASILRDLSEIEKITAENLVIDPEIAKNQIAVAKVLKAYCFHSITDKWGPAPYSQSLKGIDLLSPAYDTQKDIYLGIIRDLNDALTQMNLDPAYSPFGGGDVIYGGDMLKWKAFAHSLLLRIALRMSDTEEAEKAKTTLETNAAYAFTGNAQNAAFVWLNGAPNNNPLNQYLVLRGNVELGLSNILIDNTLLPLNDPRLPVWADEKVDGGGYRGRPYGQGDSEAAGDPVKNYSQPSGTAAVLAGTSFRPHDIVAPNAPSTLMNYAEVCFIKAEAAQRGWNAGGTVEFWYNEGITASMHEWGIADPGMIDAYLSQEKVAYSTAEGDWKQKIGVQKWLALFMQGAQGWAEWRRLDFDKLMKPVGSPVSPDIGNNIAPLRLPYPLSEQSLNNNGYLQGVSKLGGPDKISTRLWWDVH